MDETTNKKPHSEKNWTDAELDGYILDILRGNKSVKVSDIKARTQNTRFNNVSPAAIRRHIDNLQQFGELTGFFTISKSTEKDISSKKQISYTYESALTKSEFRLLFEAFSRIKGVSKKKRDKIINFINNLTPKDFISSLDYINRFREDTEENENLFKHLAIISKAIKNKTAVRFRYNDYHSDKKQYPRKNSDGQDKLYVAYPIKTVVSLGRYYLICRHLNHDNNSHIRIDRMNRVVEAMDIPKNDNSSLLPDLPKHLAEHIYMFAGETISAEFIIPEKLLNDVFDWFGKEVLIRPFDKGRFKVSVRVNEKAMLYWALQYCESVIVTSPPKLVMAITDRLKTAEITYYEVLSKEKLKS